ncbi:hypothetical protein O181_011503 [Austropuccinia psidii MF-1]|uniref:Uncharacterized protein n=1 Tax=Austropuccinia psidii MF-1 TaxID=1389203 RepID=A0A9Q3GLC1_9BASI|nr:hypothetical protein [Austropuccinia psidii MF-1]
MSQRVTLQILYGEQLNQAEHTLISSGSQGVTQPDSPVASWNSGTSISVAKSNHSSQSLVVSRGRQGSKGKNDFFQPEAEGVRPNDPEAFGIGEKSTQDPEIAVNTPDRVSSPPIINIIPTQNEHSFGTPESNMKINLMWLKRSQYTEQTQEKFEKLHEKNLTLQELLTLQKTTIHNLQEDYTKLSKASEETKIRLNKAFNEQYH